MKYLGQKKFLAIFATFLIASSISFSVTGCESFTTPKDQITTTAAAQFKSDVEHLWTQYVQELREMRSIFDEHTAQSLKFSDKIMHFTMDKINTADETGYPLYIALHGGGSAPSYFNDSQWNHMSVYYKSSVNSGVYVAPRGVTDTWNLHFVDESYPLYDRLVENMILFEGVDANRVYLLGFSAGGDGVYQIVPRMADRFAAANMSAGHHNWIGFDNLYNTPFLLQVGEYDGMYNRNTVAAENYLKLQNLNEQYSGGYTSDLFVHLGYGHNGWPDNNSSRPLATVVANPKTWLSNQDRTAKMVNSNAIDWVNKYTRNPLPTKIVWDLNTRAYRTSSAGQELLNFKHDVRKLAAASDLFYWLDVSVATQPPENGKLVVELDPARNAVVIHEAQGLDSFRVLLNDKMLNLSEPILFISKNQIFKKVKLERSRYVMTRTLYERSDKNFVFNAEFIVQANDLK